MIPLPPLDGSKVLMALLPWNMAYKLASLERYSFIILIALMMTPITSYILIPLQQLFSACVWLHPVFHLWRCHRDMHYRIIMYMKKDRSPRGKRSFCGCTEKMMSSYVYLLSWRGKAFCDRPRPGKRQADLYQTYRAEYSWPVRVRSQPYRGGLLSRAW